MFSAALRMKNFEEVLAEHKRGNSGFDDILDELTNKALVNYYDNQKISLHTIPIKRLKSVKINLARAYVLKKIGLYKIFSNTSSQTLKPLSA